MFKCLNITLNSIHSQQGEVLSLSNRIPGVEFRYIYFFSLFVYCYYYYLCQILFYFIDFIYLFFSLFKFLNSLQASSYILICLAEVCNVVRRSLDQWSSLASPAIVLRIFKGSNKGYAINIAENPSGPFIAYAKSVVLPGLHYFILQLRFLLGTGRVVSFLRLICQLR